MLYNSLLQGYRVFTHNELFVVDTTKVVAVEVHRQHLEELRCTPQVEVAKGKGLEELQGTWIADELPLFGVGVTEGSSECTCTECTKEHNSSPHKSLLQFRTKNALFHVEDNPVSKQSDR